MPLWRIFTHPTTFTYAQRESLARDITALYSRLPAFYVNVIFLNTDEADIWIGGIPRNNFVRIVVEHIARRFQSSDTDEGAAQRKAWMDRINQTLEPHIQARPELEWELHISETPRDLWRVNGIDPPPSDSQAEKTWKEQNKALPY